MQGNRGTVTLTAGEEQRELCVGNTGKVKSVALPKLTLKIFWHRLFAIYHIRKIFTIFAISLPFTQSLCSNPISLPFAQSIYHLRILFPLFQSRYLLLNLVTRYPMPN